MLKFLSTSLAFVAALTKRQGSRRCHQAADTIRAKDTARYSQSLVLLRKCQNGDDYYENQLRILEAAKLTEKLLYIGLGYSAGNIKKDLLDTYDLAHHLLWDQHPFLQINVLPLVNEGIMSWPHMYEAAEDLGFVMCDDEEEESSIATLNGQREKAGKAAVPVMKAPIVPYRGKHVYYEDATSSEQFDNVVIGGTFDHLHIGHKRLLTVAAALAQKRLTIGITSDKMLSTKRFKEEIEGIDVRTAMVKEFLQLLKPELWVDIHVIDDPFGPSIVQEDLNCVVASSETIKGAHAINTKREKAGLSTLSIVLLGRSTATSLSSTAVRQRISLGK